MDSTAIFVMGGGIVAIGMWAMILLDWRIGVWAMLFYATTMGLVVVAMFSIGMGSLALLTRDVLIVVPLYFSLFLFGGKQPYYRVPWHVSVACTAFAFVVMAGMGNPGVPNILVALIGAKVWVLYMPLVFVGACPAAVATASPKAAAEGADALIAMLPDGKIVRQALIEGRDAARESLPAGALVLDMSSSNPVDTQRLAHDLAGSGVALIDAPVSGGVKRALDGSLAIMVGGAAADLERARPVLAAMGKTITLAGGVGAGHAMKALNNYLSASGLVAMCEALVVGEAFGLDPATMIDVINNSTGRNNATDVKGKQFVISRSFASGFYTSLMAKDLRTANDVAQHLKLNMPMLREAVAYWNAADGRLGPGADHTEIFRYAEMLAEEAS